MKSSEFRAAAHDLVDWLADYMENVEDRPVLSPVEPGDVLAQLPEAPPEAGCGFSELMADVDRIIMPGMTHWQHPGFFAYFPANAAPPSILAEMIAATLGAQCMSWQTSPAATELEQRMMRWLGQMIGLPDEFEGVIQDSASSATLVALLSARERATGFRANNEGLADQERMVVYCSDQAHSSVEKDVRVAGFGDNQLRKIATDAAFAMRPDALAEAIARDIAEGLRPACVVAALGTTGSGAIDPLSDIGTICAQHNIWLHVDAAWAGSALILPEHRDMLAGIGHVDSFVFNPHKWLFTNFDCSAYFVREPEVLVRAMGIAPEYLRTAVDGAVRNFRDWGVPLGRRFRALKLWFVIRSYGVAGLQAMVRDHIALARDFAEWIVAADDFELMAPPSLGLICLRYHPKGIDDPAELERCNGALVDAVNAAGQAFLTHTKLNGEYVIRVSIGQTYTQARHVAALWAQLQQFARAST